MIYVEGKADELVVQRLSGLPRREIRPMGDKSETLRRLDEDIQSSAIVDEDPTETTPVELARMWFMSDFMESGLKVYLDRRRGNRAIVICPRLEEWLIQAANGVGLKLSEPRYNLPQSPNALHREINRDLRKLERLTDALLAAHSPSILKLQELLTQ